MTSSQLTLLTQGVAAILLFSLALGAGSAPPQAGRLVPFRGTLEGALTISADGDIEAPPAEMRSSHLGKGTQEYQSLTITQEEKDGRIWLRAEGVAHSITANGDLLRIGFLLEGPLTGSKLVPYLGWYDVLPGGTGRFAYDASATDLGEGLLAGEAILTADPDTGTTTLTFRHRFTGTLRLDVPRKP